MTAILGVSCDYHDAAAALVVDGQIIAACEEERFTRIKHDRSLPAAAIASCLAIGGLTPDDLDVVVFHEKPLVVASRVIAARQRRGPRALIPFAREMPGLLRENLLIAHRLEQVLRDLGASTAPSLRYCEHHLSHASAAFFPSPFSSAAILTVDGIGEWATATLGHGIHHRVDLLAEQRFPHSLGLLYSLITAWCGFDPNDGEYKLMGLAPFGEPTRLDALDQLVAVQPDGSLEISARLVRWWSGDPRRQRSLVSLLGQPRRPDDPITQAHADLARSVQDLTERVLIQMARHARSVTGADNLVLAGGVALNGVATGRLQRESPFDEVWVQPAAGDAGAALGAALWYWHGELGNERAAPTEDTMRGCALGPSFLLPEVADWASSLDVPVRHIPDLGERCDTVAGHLADGAIVGWFEGAMEFGPRALGHRSILADPRGHEVQRDLNVRIKGRESFRPFAPAVLAEEANSWFDLDHQSPHMSFVCPVASERLIETADEPEGLAARVQMARSQIPACTHVDGSARVQTVDASVHPAFHQLLRSFFQRTGCPVLVNTSFNRAGEPIVCTPDDALRSAIAAQLDLLVVEDQLIDLRSLQVSAAS